MLKRKFQADWLNQVRVGFITSWCLCNSNYWGDYGSTLGAINFGTTTNPSAAANAYCTNYVNNNGGRCQYDCVYDGLQSSWASQVIVSQINHI
jgi:hypothetical protein